MKYRALLLASVASACVATAAVAADMPVKSNAYAPTANLPLWNGWYLGAQLGYGYDWSGVDLNMGGVDLGTLGSAPHGFTGGGRVGYDAQFGNFVFGVVSTINGANFNGSGNTLGLIATGSNTNWWGDINGRLGLAGFGNHILPYLTGGLAYGGTKATFATTDFSTGVANTSVGWDIGAGIETKIDRNWGLFIEGKFIDLGNTQVPVIDTTTNKVVLTGTQHFQYGVINGGVNYHF